MYQPKPINPSLLRLNAAARMVLDAIDAGHIGATDGCEDKAAAVADVLQIACDRASETWPSQASPFLVYRKEVMADAIVGAHLRLLVLHLWNSNNLVNLRWLIEDADPHHITIAIELIESFARNGERDPHFMALSSEIADMAQPEEIAA